MVKRLLVNNQKGYSLVELVLVIALLGVLSAAAVVKIPSCLESLAGLRAATDQVASDIEFARRNAMVTGVNSGVQFVADGNYTVFEDTNATPLTNPLDLQPMTIDLSVNFPSVSISSSYTVIFNSFGSPVTGGGGSVTLTDSDTTKTVSVTANTGKVTRQ